MKRLKQDIYCYIRISRHFATTLAKERHLARRNTVRCFDIPLLRNFIFPDMTSLAATISLKSTVTTVSGDTKNNEVSNRFGNRSNNDEGKRLAAFVCVDNHVKSGYAVGVGTGTTAKFAIQRLMEKYQNGELKDIVCVPTSFETRQLLNESGLPLGDLERYQELDICIDGADEVDDELNCIKGGGGCLTQEKIIMSCAKYFYVVADASKMSSCLGDRWKTIPIEVLPLAYAPIKRRIEQTEGGQAQLRMAGRKAGPLVTDNGNFILDWTFRKFVLNGRVRTMDEWTALNTRLKMIPGVLETGLFLSCAQAAYFGHTDGTVTEKRASGDRRVSMLTNKRPLSPDSTDQVHLANGRERE